MINKYYAPNDNSLCALMSEFFWCSKRKFLNDPFDTHGEIINRFPIFKAELRRKGLNVDRYPTILDEFGICCFSKDKFNKHLWAMYADSYRGWVLEFDDIDFADKLYNLNLCKFIYEDVEYLNVWPNLDDFNTIIQSKKTHLPIYEILKNELKTETLFEYLLLVKEKSTWKVEQEKRLILGKGFSSKYKNEVSNGYKLNWPNGILKNIIVGHNIMPVYLETMKQIAKCKNATLYQTQTVNSGLGFELTIRKIELI